MHTARLILGTMIVLILPGSSDQAGFGQSAARSTRSGVTKVCTIFFDKDVTRPARVEDSAKECLDRAVAVLKDEPGSELFLVATADRTKDNKASNGRRRTEQDMTGEDLRYADVAAYRAINTKAYLVRWFHIDPKSIVPVTSYADGQSLVIFSAAKGTGFESLSEKTAPIIERPCTVGHCAAQYEEFLVAQQRLLISGQITAGRSK